MPNKTFGVSKVVHHRLEGLYRRLLLLETPDVSLGGTVDLPFSDHFVQ